MLGSNQRPLPCESSATVRWRFLAFAKLPQTHVFRRRHISRHFTSFTRVAARLLHKRGQLLLRLESHGHLPLGVRCCVNKPSPACGLVSYPTTVVARRH